MIQSITSYLWGYEEEDCVATQPPVAKHDQMEENEWILIRPKDYFDGPAGSEKAPSENGDTWLVEPPQCFDGQGKPQGEISAIENLLIEHPSMSIYHSNEENQEEKEIGDELAVMTKESQKPLHQRRHALQKRNPLTEVNVKLIERKSVSPKNLKRKNLVHARNHSTRKNKQYGRMNGKHSGMVGKRAA